MSNSPSASGAVGGSRPSESEDSREIPSVDFLKTSASGIPWRKVGVEIKLTLLSWPLQAAVFWTSLMDTLPLFTNLTAKEKLAAAQSGVAGGWPP
ncbi:MAG: hypothetical protein WDW38_010432 [Sanguina aurantia]